MTLITNKKALFNFEILEKLEAGLVLHGFEVKSLRLGRGSLAGARALVRGGEAFVVGMHIPPWQEKNAPKEYDPERSRKLLLSKKEAARVADAEARRGLTAVPLSVYSKGRNLKMSIGIARGKKKHDKREAIKRRDVERDLRRALKK